MLQIRSNKGIKLESVFYTEAVTRQLITAFYNVLLNELWQYIDCLIRFQDFGRKDIIQRKVLWHTDNFLLVFDGKYGRRF